MKKIAHKILIIFLVIGFTFAAGLIAYTTSVYLEWSSREDQILEKLFTYKKQLDYLRKPVPAEGSIGKITIGAVAIPSKVYDRNQKLIGEFYTERRTLIPIERMPPYLPRALVASEDRRFYEHSGISFRAIARAMITNLVTLSYAQGGSTITQQLAKVLFTEQEKTIRRKVFELFCTYAIEERFTKTEILEMYLNLIFMGHSNYGIESAARFFFDKGAQALTLPEAAMLIGILPSPNRFSPLNDLKIALKRQQLVLGAMEEMGYITPEKSKESIEKFHIAWDIYKVDSAYRSDIGAFSGESYRINRAPYFLDYVKNNLLRRYGYSSEAILKGGLRIYTTLDFDKQERAFIALKRGVETQRERFRSLMKNASPQKARQYEEAIKRTNGVFLTIEPQTGHILTMIGGAEYSNSNFFNRSVNAYRQVGSLMKPFIYYSALEKKAITPATIVNDEKTVVGKFQFDNYDRTWLGKITAYDALRKSRNTIAIQLLQETGLDNIYTLFESILDTPSEVPHYAPEDPRVKERMSREQNDFATQSDDPKMQNIKERIPRELGVAIGAVEFSPLEMAQAYGALLNDGYRVEPEFITKIEDASGKLLWSAPQRIKKYRILEPDAAYITISMLEGVVRDGGTAGWIAKYRQAHPDIQWPALAGKSGTTSDYNDVWFAGLTPNEVSIVWIGTDHNESLGKSATGGSLAAPIWVDYLATAPPVSPAEYQPISSFEYNYTLGNITRENFCPESGGVPYEEKSCPHIVSSFPFIRGSEPDFFCPLHSPQESEEEKPLGKTHKALQGESVEAPSGVDPI